MGSDYYRHVYSNQNPSTLQGVLMDLTFYIIDTETTGLDFRKHEIIQFGGIKLSSDGRLYEPIELKILPEHLDRASPDALKINGYTCQDWTSAVSKHKAAEQIYSWFDDGSGLKILAGHNVLFDFRFLLPIMTPYQRLPYHKICTKELSVALLSVRGLKKFSLSSCCEFAGIEHLNAHDALADALACAELLNFFLQNFRKPIH